MKNFLKILLIFLFVSTLFPLLNGNGEKAGSNFVRFGSAFFIFLVIYLLVQVFKYIKNKFSNKEIVPLVMREKSILHYSTGVDNLASEEINYKNSNQVKNKLATDISEVGKKQVPFQWVVILSLISYIVAFCATIYKENGIIFSVKLFDHSSLLFDYLAQAFGGSLIFPMAHIGVASFFKAKRNKGSLKNIFIGWSIATIIIQFLVAISSMPKQQAVSSVDFITNNTSIVVPTSQALPTPVHSPYQFHHKGCDFTVEFPEEPNVKIITVQGKEIKQAQWINPIAGDGTVLRSECIELASLSYPTEDSEVKGWILGLLENYAESNGLFYTEYQYGLGDTGPVGAVRGIKSIMGKPVTYKVAAIVGRSYLLILYTGGISETFPQREIIAFHSSVKKYCVDAACSNASEGPSVMGSDDAGTIDETPIIGESTAAPKFEDYPSAPVYEGATAPLENKGDHFRTRNAEALANNPIVFDSEYVISTIGCGTGCVFQSFLSKRTGKLEISFGGEGGQRVREVRPDSKLIVTAGPDDENKESKDLYSYYYVFDNGKLNQIAKIKTEFPECEGHSWCIIHSPY